MATLPINNFNTPVFKENKDVKSTVKPKRKPLGTLTNHISSTSKVGGRKIGGLEHFAKKIEFNIQENVCTPALRKAEQKTEKVIQLKDSSVKEEEEEWPEMEKMNLAPPSVDNYEDVWPLQEQPSAYLGQILNWFPFDPSHRARIEDDLDKLSVLQDDAFLADLSVFDELPKRCRPKPMLPPLTEYVFEFPLYQ